ncbi:MAG: hypothetical protein U5K99_02180 [Anaerolineales bacterium]|nr:hypothetical protein [Anaerolineales bacterium]
MKNKVKSWVLLVVFSFSLVPFGAGQAEGPGRTFEEARFLLYLGGTFLEDEISLDTAAHSPELMVPVPGVRQAEGADEILDRMIHATKQERNDLDANCRQLQSRYQSAGDKEAVQKVDTYCKAERQRLTRRISFLHKLRGDRRKALTRFWHSIKRGSANFWQQIGPVGRNILRKVGDEAFNTVASGGSLSGGVVRRLVKQAVKSTAREQLKQVMCRGLERLLQGQVKIAREAGVLEEDDREDNPQFLEGDMDQINDDEVSDDEVQELSTPEPADNQEEEEDECPGDSSWVAPYWEEVIRPQLIAEGRACQRTAIAIYKSCLQDQGIQGVCPEDALAFCEPQYQDIPRDETSGPVIQAVAVMHSEAESVSASLVYSSSGGPVGGQINYTLKDSHLCTITVTSILSGTFSLDTCTLSGTAQVTEVYDGSACASVCSGGSCPVTRSASVPWQATLEDGKLFGGVDGNGSSISGFGFGTP